MPYLFRFPWVVLIILAMNSAVAGAANSKAASLAETQRVRRAAELRRVLGNLIDRSYNDGGVWPNAQSIAGTLQNGWNYSPPVPHDPRFPQEFGKATVVLYETFALHPDGVWVAYADGHLEYAESPRVLAECQSQSAIIDAAIAANGHPVDGQERISADQKKTTVPPATKRAGIKPAGNLKLKVVDAQDHPIAGVLIGSDGQFGNQIAAADRVTFDHGKDHRAAVTDADGLTSVRADEVFSASFESPADEPAATLYFLHEQRGLAALEEILPAQFGADSVRTVRLQPVCKIACDATCLGLAAAGRDLSETTAIVCSPGKERLRALSAWSVHGGFEFLLPPGDYVMSVFAPDALYAKRYFHVDPAQTPMHLRPDLTPTVDALLIGSPATDFRSIKEWKNGGPITLAGLRGKVVLLDFWGYWCGPCVGSMPALMALHDEFKDHGLVIVAIHDDSIGSIREMDQKLTAARQKFWNGRELPFLIALDGGGETRIQGTALTALGATTAAYGVMDFPTSILVGPDGVILQNIDVRNADAREQVRRALGLVPPVSK